MDLSEAEKAEAIALIAAGQPLPSRWRQSLFPDAPDRVELVWPGKAAIPADPVPPPELRVVERYGDADGWRDRLILGDNLPILAALRDGPLRAEIAAAGGLRLIYLDPPFLTGGTFAVEVPIGETTPGLPPRTLSLPAYADNPAGGLPAYLSAMQSRLRLMHDLLAPDGSLYLHCDHRLSAALRLLLDEIFGPERFVNEIVWHYGLGNPGGSRAFARKHDTILLYAKTAGYRFNRLRGDVTHAMAAKYRHQDEGGRFLRSYGKKYYLKGGKPFDSVWTIPTLGATDGQRLGYPTQKPEALLERIVLAATDPGDLVADPFAGSGTLAVVAARLGRRWIAADSSPLAIRTTRTRLLRAGTTGFEILRSIDQTAPTPGLAYTAHLEATAVWGEEGIVVTLAGYRPLAQQAPVATRSPGLAVEDGALVRARGTPDGVVAERLTTTWLDWLERWSVEIVRDGTPPDAPHTPDWWIERVAPSRHLRQVSDPLPPAGAAPCRIVVRATDLLGHEATATLSLGR